jgi:hypothetical protein
MSDDSKAFFDVLHALHSEGLLKQILIVGGWCQHLYRRHFHDPPTLSALRTYDLDLLLPRKLQISPPVHISRLMLSLGYEESTALDGSTHYMSEALNVEFLVPEIGRGSDRSYRVASLGINAQALRLLDMLQAHPMTVPYEGLPVRVPDPIDFAFHKLLISSRRRDPRKAEKDILTGRELLLFLNEQPVWRASITPRFQSLSRNRKADLVNLARRRIPELLSLTSETQQTSKADDLEL